MPPMGTVNLHGSLLPQYRGAAPVNWAVINGEKETGVTTFKLKHEIDTGNILLQEKIPIRDDETAGELHDRMKEIGADLLVRTVDGIISKKIAEIPQPGPGAGSEGIEGALRHAPKLTTGTSKIIWERPVDEVYDLVRGLSPYPGAFTVLNGKTLKIYRAKKEKTIPGVPVGEYETDNRTFLKFACSGGYLFAEEIQIEGKKKMGIAEFLRGFRS